MWGDEMQTWIIEPRDPLITRDARPFGPTLGAEATSLVFPLPSTTTGALRERAGMTAGGVFDRSRTSEVQRIRVRGPLLVQLDEGGEISRWFSPAPADVLLVRHERSIVMRQLAPLAVPVGALHSLPDGLVPIGPYPIEPASRASGPRYWDWSLLETWLLTPQDNIVMSDNLGIGGPLLEQRIHVRIASETQAPIEGFLFQTRGLEFMVEGRRLALAVVSDVSLDQSTDGIAPLGGERRMATWRMSTQKLPSCPEALIQTILEQRACRVILLTPAAFTTGYRPTWLLEPREGVTPYLRAALVPSRQIASGWDLDRQRPKPLRWLVPAGAVFFVELTGSRDALRRWAQHYWMESVSDEEQDRRDGFGLAVLGSWSGELRPMEVHHA